jgi:hypothetical protein
LLYRGIGNILEPDVAKGVEDNSFQASPSLFSIRGFRASRVKTKS